MNGKIIYGIADQLSAHCWTTPHHAFLTRCNWIVQKATGYWEAMRLPNGG